MKLREIMSFNPVTLTPEHTIREACKIFLEQQIDGAPVVTKKNEVLGILTKNHIYRLVCNNKNPGTLVGEVMEQKVIVGRPDEKLEIFIKGNLGRLPIVDKNQLVGMITYTDVARTYFKRYNLSLNKYEAIINSTYNLIISVDKYGNIEFFNQAAEKFLGFEVEKVRGKEIVDIFPNSGLIEILETGSTKLVQKIKLNDRMFISNRSPIKNGNKIIGAVAVLQDISELESISRELENVKELYNELDAIIESSYDGIYLTNGEGITLRLNEAFEKITGEKSSELVGRDVNDLVKERGVVSESVSALVLKSKNVVTIMQTTKIGRIALTTGIPVFDRKGKIFRVVSNVRDITELNLLKQELEQAQGLNKHYESELKALRFQYSGSEKLIVNSKIMKDLLDMVIRLAQVDSTILITGESGTGKELIAETIHNSSPRKNLPFIKINCGAIPGNLLESELFGYDSGAFTGAKKGGKAGYFEMADRGTLFLDEIAEMPLALQVKLLRVLQGKEILRIGGEKTINVDVRIIAATNCDILEMVKKKEFRKDLYYRLNVIPVEVPALRERKEEIPALTAHFIDRLNKKYKMNKKLSSDVIDVFMKYDWPGNVRELENLIERLVVITPGTILSTEDLPLHLKEITLEQTRPAVSVAGIIPLREAVESVERQILELAYSRYKTTREIARKLEVDASTVVRKAARYGISQTNHSD